MTCHDARELFSPRVDDALTPAERAGLDAHLAGCAECRRELTRFEGTVGLLRAAAPIRAPAGFVDRVLAAVQPLPWYSRLGRRLFWPLEVKLPLEAAALVLVAVGAVYLLERSPELGRMTAQQEPANKRATEQFRDALQSAPAAPPAKRAPAEPRLGSSDAPAKDVPRASTRPSFEEPVARQVAPASPPDAPGRKEQAPAPPAAAPPPVARPQAAEPERAAETSESAFAREGQRRDAVEERAKSDVEEKAKSGVVQDRRRFATSKAAAQGELSGRLAVGDREAAGRALAELLARVGATEVARRGEGRDVVVEVVVPGAAYRELTEGLARIGRWQPDQPPAESPEATVRLTLRLSD